MTIPSLTPIIKTFEELAKAQNEGKVQVFANKNALYYQTIKVSQ
jgi:hypothetical protein